MCDYCTLSNLYLIIPQLVPGTEQDILFEIQIF